MAETMTFEEAAQSLLTDTTERTLSGTFLMDTLVGRASSTLDVLLIESMTTQLFANAMTTRWLALVGFGEHSPESATNLVCIELVDLVVKVDPAKEGKRLSDSTLDLVEKTALNLRKLVEKRMAGEE